MGETARVLASGGKFTLGYAQALIKGIDQTMAARRPQNAKGERYDTNHATFVFGHLGLYHVRIAEMLGFPVIDGMRAPEGWDVLFKAGVACQDDPQGTIYPSWDLVREHYFRSAHLAIETIVLAHDAQLTAPCPNESWRDRFPYAGSALNFLLMGHPMMHLGQVSAWRRAMGLPSAMS